MSTPNPEKFARLVLEHLAYIQADISTTQAMIAELLEAGKDTKDITALAKWKAYANETAHRILEKSLREAGLDDSSETPSTQP
jgi:type II secretory pathway component PulM